jgi:hypothetical protein
MAAIRLIMALPMLGSWMASDWGLQIGQIALS